MNNKLILFMVIVFSITSVYAHEVNNYGGISGSANLPPEGTRIDQKLSEYYNMPVANGNDLTYVYVSGFWYTSEKLNNFPSESVIHGKSPYSQGVSASSTVAMPISSSISVVFLGVALLISRRRSIK